MLKRIALAFAVAAVAAPTALAAPLEPGATKPDQGTYLRSLDGIENVRAIPDSNVRALDGVENVRAIPDSNVRALDRVENIRTEPRGVEQPVLTASPSSFDWGDAGVGAGLAFGAILLAAAAALSVRQYGRLGQI
jgi:hypothetical protein